MYTSLSFLSPFFSHQARRPSENTRVISHMICFNRKAGRWLFHVAPLAMIIFSLYLVFLVYAPATNLLLSQLNTNAAPAAPPPAPPETNVEPSRAIGSFVLHDEDIFLEDYRQMNKSMKIFIYPHSRKEPFSHALLPVDFDPTGNYASEGYFFKALVKSHFITKDPEKADFFFMPFSITALRNDKKVSVGGIPSFIRRYVSNIQQKYPFWNKTGGVDHFYVACHSVGRSAMSKTEEVKVNAIQVVCSASHFLKGYVAHKDVSLPQVWPRPNAPPSFRSTKRRRLAFFSGAMNSPVRQKLLQAWGNDSEIFVRRGRLPTPYSDAMLGAKFCLHAKGYEVNTARIADSIFYGCIPIVLADQYDLPFSDLLDWRRFALIVATEDIPHLKKILHRITPQEYDAMHKNLLRARKHFQWHVPASDYDVFHMVMYELWRRRGITRLPFVTSNTTVVAEGKKHR